MAKRVNGFQIETEHTEFGVGLGVENGEPIVVECENEEDAYETSGRNPGAQVVARQVFETSWAELPHVPSNG